MSSNKGKRRLAKDKERTKKAKNSARAFRRADKARASQQRMQERPAPTTNANTIKSLMIEQGVKGDFKDYVIISGNRLINWKGSFDIKLDDGATLGVDGVALIHKRKLHNIVGDKQAARFWHPQLGRLIEVPEGTKPSKKPSKKND